MEWQPIETAPWGEEVLVTGGSGCVIRKRFIINAYRERDWHGGDWNDATGEPLRNHGWVPTHWAPLLEPPSNAAIKGGR